MAAQIPVSNLSEPARSWSHCLRQTTLLLLSTLAAAFCEFVSHALSRLEGHKSRRLRAKLAEFHEQTVRQQQPATTETAAIRQCGHAFTDDAIQQHDRCSICFDDMDDTANGMVLTLPCHATHRFHAGCLAKCWKTSRTVPQTLCPICRHECESHHQAQAMEALAAIEAASVQ